jgi:hypothetical protein
MTTVRVIRGQKVDLECGGMFRLEAGKTYHDDGTTGLDVYVAEGLADGSMVEAKRDATTITVSAHNLLRR